MQVTEATDANYTDARDATNSSLVHRLGRPRSHLLVSQIWGIRFIYHMVFLVKAKYFYYTLKIMHSI